MANAPGRLLSRSPRALALLAAVLAAWIVLGGIAAPWLAARLAPGSAPAEALAAWHGSWWDGAVILLVLAATVPAYAALRDGRLARRLPPATAEGLGAIRMWVAAILLASVLWEDLASTAHLPRGMLDLDRHWLVGTLHSLPLGFDRFLASPAALGAFELAAALLLALAAAGLFTRWTVPLGAAAYLLFASIPRAYAWSYHTGLVPLYALLLLSFTPCGDAWSVDRRLRRRRGEPVVPAREPAPRYALGRYLVWMAVALPYTLAALSKVRRSGLLWWRPEHMKQMLVGTVVEPMHFDFELTYRLLHAPGWIFGALGLAALLGELAFVLVLVNRLARLVVPAVTAAMHVGILLMQNILFPDLIAIQAVFYDWSPLRDRVAAGWARLRGSATADAPRPVPAAAPPTVAASGDAGRTFRREAAVARAFLLVAVLAWATRTERFPITAMQMFSARQPARPVEYVRPYVVYADGTREPARFERWIGAMADTRYRRIIRWDEHPERIPLLRDFLDAAARRAGAASPPRHVARFELEHRRWDFRRHPDDPQRGELLGVLRHVPDAGVSARAAR